MRLIKRKMVEVELENGNTRPQTDRNAETNFSAAEHRMLQSSDQNIINMIVRSSGWSPSGRCG